MKLAENAAPDKYVYTGYGIRLAFRILLPEGSMRKNVVLRGGNTSSSVDVDNKEKDTLICSKVPTQGYYVNSESSVYN